MPEKYTKARFWKCALQVNPYSYIKYRGADHNLSEEEYNDKLLEICKKANIKIIGIADHGNVEDIDKIRNLMNLNNIIVFPGFEITSSEKAHFVALFSQTTTTEELNRYLGNLELTDLENGVRPSALSAEQILKKIEQLEGFIYAAHCTSNNGILKQRLDHVWKSKYLKAVQIPASIENLKGVENDLYRKVILNKIPEYKREEPIAVINAKDVEAPETLEDSNATCLIKMTKPNFEAFKLAFMDPKSRVRLNSDIAEKYYSRIETLSIIGGYLDGININFSEHLNSVIGGRGTGKSTLLECIRYAFDIKPIGQNAFKQHNEIIKANIGKSKARIELTVRSSKMNGKKFVIARRYGESPIVKDEEGKISPFSPLDLLPDIEILGQNEIYEIAQNAELQRRLLARFLGNKEDDKSLKIKEALEELGINRIRLSEALDRTAEAEDEIAKLSKLEAQVNQFKSLGFEDKLKIIPLLATEKSLQKRVNEQELKNINASFEAIKDNLPDTIFLSDKALEKLLHKKEFLKIRDELDNLKEYAETLVLNWRKKFDDSKEKIGNFANELNKKIKEEEDNLEKIFKELPASEGKSGREIGFEYQKLVKEIEKIRPQKNLAERQKEAIQELNNKRKEIIAELSEYRADRSAKFERLLKKLGKKLKGQLKLTIKPESDKKSVIDFLLKCNLEGIGEKRLAWIQDTEDFNPIKLSELIRAGHENLVNCDWEITSTVATALTKMTHKQILELEEIESADLILIELNISHTEKEDYRSIQNLSTGQQCTAILHLLLLQNKDPLIMDQPEDNLDNAFIAERIVAELRSEKVNRQFIFATHNANIPVFGDAEWIGVFEFSEGDTSILQGAIDIKEVRDKTANILEGGKAAFNQRKNKYGF